MSKSHVVLIVMNYQVNIFMSTAQHRIAKVLANSDLNTKPILYNIISIKVFFH